MGSFLDFAKSIQARGAKADEQINKAVAQLAVAVVSEVAPDTPVLTGRASSNWLSAVGAPIMYYKENPNMNGGPQESIDMAVDVLRGYKGGVIHITNNVPYIADLNAGTSRKAPALFVQAAILRATYSFKSFKLNL